MGWLSWWLDGRLFNTANSCWENIRLWLLVYRSLFMLGQNYVTVHYATKAETHLQNINQNEIFVFTFHQHLTKLHQPVPLPLSYKPYKSMTPFCSKEILNNTLFRIQHVFLKAPPPPLPQQTKWAVPNGITMKNTKFEPNKTIKPSLSYKLKLI